MAVGSALLLLLLAAGVWGIARRLRQRVGLPQGRVRYDDAGDARRPARPLVSHRYRLTGRPDYLLDHAGGIVPVEVKPTRHAPAPYDSDVLQLAAYCLLVEETFGQAPPFGVLRYAETSWEIPFDEPLRTRLLQTMEAMDAAARAPEVPRSHDHPARCARCSQRAHCDQRLA